ncbi:MAG TPA: lysylphosphatidylglycerol synthase transmembrane domain-containing protein [Anaerolineales bacterium]|nr:lysylphosphatidylglycerol synthase transmembrane domain-containing protein [Anaerolineales bacterium]
MTEKRAPNRLWIILRWLVPLGLIAFLLSQVDWGEILPLLARVSWTSLLASAFAFLLSQFVIAVRWQYLLRVQEIRLPLPRLTWLVLVGAFASNFLPTTVGGDLVKMAAVANGQPKRAAAAASVLADRLFNLAAMFFWLPFAFTLQVANPLIETGAASMSALTRIPLVEKIWSRVKRVFEAGRAWFTSPLTVIVALALSWLSIGLSFVSFWIVTLALGISLSFWQASAVAVLSYFAALLPISVNGLGLLEGSVTALLVLQGASLEQGVAAAVLIRLVTMAVSLLGGVRLLWWRGLLAEASAQGGHDF